MKKVQIKVEFNEEKLKAIKLSLDAKQRDFDEEIVNYLDGLYNKNVPKVLKQYIESGLSTGKETIKHDAAVKDFKTE